MNAASLAFEGGDSETAVSRAYYAAYHSVIAVVEARSGPQASWSHRVRQFANRIPALEPMSSELGALYRLRVVADYESGPISSDRAEAALYLSSQVFEISQELV